MITGTINWGIIGCGDVCEVKSGPAFNKIAGSRLTAVMRRNKEKASDFATRHNVPYFFDNARELINHSEVYAIYIATPPSTHEEYSIAALQAGKPVYVEKPVSITTESCRRMIACSAQTGVPVSVAHYRRELDLFKKVEELVKSGSLGNIRLIQIETLQPPSSKFIIKTEKNWRVQTAISGGGIFYDLAPHQIDILIKLFGPPVHFEGHSLNQSNLYDAPDFTMMKAVFQNQIAMSGVWAFNMPQDVHEDRCTIIGDKGKLEFAFFKLGPLKLITEQREQIIDMKYPTNIQLPMIESVAKFFRGEGPNPCSLDEALEGLRIIETVGVLR
jgi:1,5-anhydro-D-fructose reductase (1,5-anhydro-D-mannitol-forming)